MPRVVDHDERRRKIAQVVSDLVLKGGTDAVTIRGVAQVCGFSTTVVCHYFESKKEMLAFTQRIAWQRGLGSIREASVSGKDLFTCLHHALPITKQGWQDWHCWLAFWGMSPEERGIEDDWGESNSASRGVFSEVVARAQARGEFDPAADPQEIAVSLQIIVNGIASLAAQERKLWPAARQREVLLRQLVRFGYRAGKSPPRRRRAQATAALGIKNAVPDEGATGWENRAAAKLRDR